MKTQRFIPFLIALSLVLPASAKKLNWQAVQKIPPGTQIYVTTNSGTPCIFQRATADELLCTVEHSELPNKDRTFSRTEIRNVCVGDLKTCTAFDWSAGTPSLMAAFAAGGTWDAQRPAALAGVKLGLAGISMDLQYDRLDAHSGFSVEGSGVFPLLRVPRFRPQNDRLFFRVYGEPGLGYRAGEGSFGQYASAKALVLLGDKWVDGNRPSPYIELQRRFPFNSPLSGDNRIAFGFMWVLCGHCGMD